MSEHPLTGVVLKLRRAEVHYQALRSDIVSYLNQQPRALTVVPQGQSHDGCYAVALHVITHPPPELGTLLGDFVHNCRSALDYLVHELVLANKGKPTNRIQFPISETPKDFRYQAFSLGMLKGVDERAVKAIESHQPYLWVPQGRSISDNGLFALHHLSNRDKHRTLTLSALGARVEWRATTSTGVILKQGHVEEWLQDGQIVRYSTGLTQTDIKVQERVSGDVIFKAPPFGNWPVCSMLNQIRNVIGQLVLPTFEPFFDPLPDDLRPPIQRIPYIVGP